MQRKYLQLILAFLLVALPTLFLETNADEFKNLSFEYATYDKQPRSWNIEGYAESYSASLTDEVSRQGDKSLHISVNKGELYALLSVDSQLVSGKEVTFSGLITAAADNNATTELMMIVPNGGEPQSSGAVNLPANIWTKLSLSHRFDALPQTQVLLVVKTAGTGAFWADNFSIMIGGVAFGVGKPDFRAPTQNEVNTLNDLVSAITPDKSTALQRQLKALDPIVGSANVIALGENSHGSSSIFKLKLAMIQYLVENANVRMFALESPAVEADTINDYVNGDNVTREEILSSLAYSSWRTQEMLDIVEWIKSYNETAKEKVQFRGFDMQNSYAAMHYLLDYTQKSHEPIHTKLKELQSLLDIEKPTEFNLESAVALSSSVKDYFKAGSHDVERKKAYRYSVIVEQSIQLRSAKTGANRDHFMAKNIQALQQACRCRVVVSGDNDHVRKQDGRAGYFLNKHYGRSYKVLGFTYNKGTYGALGDQDAYPVHPGYVGTHEYLFNKAAADNFILNLNAADEIPLLTEKQGFRYIGSRPQEATQFFEMNLKDNFDAIIYLENSTHTQRIE